MHLRRSLLALVLLAASSVHAFERRVLDLSDTQATWDISGAENNTARHELSSGILHIDSDNFWSALIQFENISVDLYRIPADAVIELEVRGVVYDRGPSLRLVFFDKPWVLQSEFFVPLTKLHGTEWTRLRSTATWGEMLKKSGSLGDTPFAENLFLNFVAEEGNQPWRISIRRIAIVLPGTQPAQAR
jgi:hypothetical protein